MSDSILARCAKAQRSAENNQWPPDIIGKQALCQGPNMPLTLRYLPMVLTFLSPSSRGRAGRKLVTETVLGLALLIFPSPWTFRSHCPLPGHRVALHGIFKPLPEFLQALEALILMRTSAAVPWINPCTWRGRDVNLGCPSGYRLSHRAAVCSS